MDARQLFGVVKFRGTLTCRNLAIVIALSQKHSKGSSSATRTGLRLKQVDIGHSEMSKTKQERQNDKLVAGGAITQHLTLTLDLTLA